MTDAQSTLNTQIRS